MVTVTNKCMYVVQFAFHNEWLDCSYNAFFEKKEDAVSRKESLSVAGYPTILRVVRRTTTDIEVA